MKPLAELLARFPFPNGDPFKPVLEPLDVRVALAWESVEKVWFPPSDRVPEDDRALWSWLWAGVRFDLPGLALACKLDEDSADDRLLALAILHLIHPDGTVAPVMYAPAEEPKKLPAASTAGVN